MSVKAMSWVWEHSAAKSTARLVLLALADHAGHDGGDAWPSVGRLADRCGMSERTVQVALRQLVDLGEIEVASQAGPGGVNRYRLTLTPAGSAPPQDLHPRKAPRGTPQDLHPTPAGSAPEPSMNRHEPPSSVSGQVNTPVPPSIWKSYAEKKAKTTTSPIGDRRAWLAQTTRNAKAEHAERAEWIWSTYEITESQLVAVLLGSTHVLNSLRKRDAA